MNISVALASYNGEKYISKQLLSILSQLSYDDEVIISDDGSNDNTIDIIKFLMKDYPQIKLIEGPKKGVIKNFENAIANCKNDIIFLSDQDDIWKPNKVKTICKIFKENDVDLVLHNMDYFGAINKEKIINYRKGFFTNIIKSEYWGCCMAFTNKFKNEIIPFNENVCAHDQWIGLISEKSKRTYFYDESLIEHRIHINNVTSSLSFLEKIKFRINTIKSVKSEIMNYCFLELPILMLIIFMTMPFDSRHLYIVYFAIFFIYMLFNLKTYGINDLIDKLTLNKYSCISVGLLSIWFYGVIIGLLQGNRIPYIIMNFAGMTLYSSFIIFSIYKPKIDNTIILFSRIGIFVMILSLIVYLCVVPFYTQMIAIIEKVPLINTFQSGGTNLLYTIQLSIFPTIALSFYDLLQRKQIFKNLFIFLLGFITIFLCIRQGGFKLAYLLTLLFVVFIFIKDKIKFFQNHKYIYLFLITLIVGIYIVFSFLTKGLIYDIFNLRDFGNSFRMEQLILGIKDCTFFGNGLGATFSTGIEVYPYQPYGIEITYLNIMHKFGIFSIFIFITYIGLYILSYIKNNTKTSREIIFIISLISFIFPSLGNPYLFHPICVILHSLALYYIFEI